MKKLTSVQADEDLLREAKSAGINFREVFEEGLQAALGKPREGRLKRDEHGTYIVTEGIQKLMEVFYSEFRGYVNGVGARYDRSKARIWITKRAAEAGMDIDEMLLLFEQRYEEELAKHEATPRIVVSEEALRELEDKYFESFKIFIDTLRREQSSKKLLSEVAIRSELESLSWRWIEVRRKFLMNVSRRVLWSKMKDRYNEGVGQTVL